MSRFGLSTIIAGIAALAPAGVALAVPSSGRPGPNDGAEAEFRSPAGAQNRTETIIDLRCAFGIAQEVSELLQ